MAGAETDSAPAEPEGWTCREAAGSSNPPPGRSEERPLLLHVRPALSAT